MAEVIRMDFTTKRLRTYPRRLNGDGPKIINPHPRVSVLHEDHAGFTIVEAKLLPGEGVCWQCTSIAKDPDGKLFRCPVCGGFFND